MNLLWAGIAPAILFLFHFLLPSGTNGICPHLTLKGLVQESLGPLGPL